MERNHYTIAELHLACLLQKSNYDNKKRNLLIFLLEYKYNGKILSITAFIISWRFLFFYYLHGGGITIGCSTFFSTKTEGKRLGWDKYLYKGTTRQSLQTMLSPVLFISENCKIHKISFSWDHDNMANLL